MELETRWFGDGCPPQDRIFMTPEKCAEVVETVKKKGLRVVLTSGSFDMLHIGHCRYLAEAKKLGQVLVVGVESDAKVKSRKKGQHRPVVPGDERYEMLAHLRHVDLITIKDVSHPKWHLIKLLRPDVLQAVEGTYTEEELVELKEFCGSVVVQKRQAETSTSAKIRLLVIGGMTELANKLAERLPQVLVGFLTARVKDMSEELHTMLPDILTSTVEEMKEKAA